MFLYITEQGAVIRKKGKSIIIEKDGVVIAEKELHHIETICCYGGVHITEPALKTLLIDGIEVAFMSINGKLLGQLTPPKHKNIELRMRQYKIYNTENRLLYAKPFVLAKINSHLKTIDKYAQYHDEIENNASFVAMKEALEKARDANSIDSLLGIEGMASKRYFSLYNLMFTDELKFEKRSSRPPLNEVNAALSFGYTVLGNEIASLLDAQGYDPYIGFLHAIEYGRQSLALDFLEIFRTSIDRLTLTIFNKRILKKEDFENRDGGVYMKKSALKKWFYQYENYARTPHPYLTGESDIRAVLKNETLNLALAIRDNKVYTPMEKN